MPSDPFHIGAQMTSILRSHYSTYGASRLLLVFTDGGGDQNVARIPTQNSLICLFIQINLDMLVALRCCPTQSWMNSPKPIMSTLNLAQQNCSLEGAKMYDVLEQKVKSVNSMNKLRNLTKPCAELQESFMESMNPMKEIVNSRSESMLLKDEKISVQQSATSENEHLQNLCRVFSFYTHNH